MRPDSSTNNLTNMAVWIVKVYAPSSAIPLHSGVNMHILLLEICLPREYVLPLLYRKCIV